MVDNTQKEKLKSPTQLEMEPNIIIHYRLKDTIPTPSPPTFVATIVIIPPCTQFIHNMQRRRVLEEIGWGFSLTTWSQRFSIMGMNISIASNVDNMVIEHPILVDIMKFSKKVTYECYLICLCV